MTQIYRGVQEQQQQKKKKIQNKQTKKNPTQNTVYILENVLQHTLVQFAKIRPGVRSH